MRAATNDARNDDQRQSKRQGGQQPTNETIRLPRAPGAHVDATRCACGALYSRSTYGVRWSEGVACVRQVAFAAGDTTGGKRPRTSVLWAMKAIKLERWYCDHAACTHPEAHPEAHAETHPEAEARNMSDAPATLYEPDPVLGF